MIFKIYIYIYPIFEAASCIAVFKILLYHFQLRKMIFLLVLEVKTLLFFHLKAIYHFKLWFCQEWLLPVSKCRSRVLAHRVVTSRRLHIKKGLSRNPIKGKFLTLNPSSETLRRRLFLEKYLEPGGCTLQHWDSTHSHCHGDQFSQQAHPAVISLVPLGTKKG